MRRLMFTAGCFFAGMAPVLLVLMFVTADMPIAGGLFTVIFFVGIGVALSAPFILAPPPERDGTFFIFGSWKIILVTQLFRGVIWLGAKILEAIWTVTFRTLQRRDAELPFEN
jgi:hypothetical protein